MFKGSQATYDDTISYRNSGGAAEPLELSELKEGGVLQPRHTDQSREGLRLQPRFHP